MLSERYVVSCTHIHILYYTEYVCTLTEKKCRPIFIKDIQPPRALARKEKYMTRMHTHTL